MITQETLSNLIRADSPQDYIINGPKNDYQKECIIRYAWRCDWITMEPKNRGIMNLSAYGLADFLLIGYDGIKFTYHTGNREA